jgi:hypothetical protein
MHAFYPRLLDRVPEEPDLANVASKPTVTARYLRDVELRKV